MHVSTLRCLSLLLSPLRIRSCLYFLVVGCLSTSFTVDNRVVSTSFTMDNRVISLLLLQRTISLLLLPWTVRSSLYFFYRGQSGRLCTCTTSDEVVCLCQCIRGDQMDSPEDSEPQQNQGTRLTALLLTSAEVVQN